MKEIEIQEEPISATEYKIAWMAMHEAYSIAPLTTYSAERIILSAKYLVAAYSNMGLGLNNKELKNARLVIMAFNVAKFQRTKS